MAQKITQPSGAVKTSAKSTAESQPVHFVFDKSNYTWLIAAVVVVILGSPQLPDVGHNRYL
jgi:hypothetical protein